MEPRIRNTLTHVKHNSRELNYAGREISASTATGYSKTHKAELD